jgi:hypothetical protein
MNTTILAYNQALTESDKAIADLLAQVIVDCLPETENKICHAHPVWFLEGNPIVGYNKLKNCIRLLFWSGQSFEEDILQNAGSFKAAEMRFTAPDQIHTNDLKRLLRKAELIQWEYKNIVKQKGKLERLK